MSDPPETPLPPPPPPGAGSDGPSMESGGIYIRWRDRLWQEQPDGSYLVWNEDAHVWEPSRTQPPSEGGSVSTRECPNCGKRVKASLRSCPYCEYGFEDRVVTPVPAVTPARKKPKAKVRSRAISPQLLLVVLGLAGLIAAGVFLKVRSDSCDNWKAGVASYTRLAVEAQGLPRGLTEEEFRQLNEDRFADTRPGGCG